MDYSPPGSSVHGILQARTLEVVVILFSRGSSRSRDCEPRSPVLQAESSPSAPPGKPRPRPRRVCSSGLPFLPHVHKPIPRICSVSPLQIDFLLTFLSFPHRRCSDLPLSSGLPSPPWMPQKLRSQERLFLLSGPGSCFPGRSCKSI